MSSVLFLFSFYCSVLHRHLHSFPTRRSSDLDAVSVVRHFAGVQGQPEPDAFLCGVIPVVGGQSVGEEAEEQVGEQRLGDLRSEEHTSELQSRGHLVCRLLLEKKKKMNMCD